MGALDGRTALVAGASSGIGLATALALADAGARVHAAARRAELIEDAAGERDVIAHRLDVTDRAAVERIVARVAADGPLHALVAAAGTNIPRRRLADLAPEAFDALVAVNLTGAFNLVRACLEPLRATHGDVVLIGSVSGSWPDRSGPAYQATKAALLGLARGAAFDEQDGVRFTTIMPGVVDTAILDQRPEPPTAEQRAQMLQPDDVAAACLFAISLPPRAHVPELTILPSGLQALGRTG
ncbi:MAG TPA: SDR family NAD(P)-dependent oxidoreductase [Solirubrobacteraceae bacterium]